MSLRDEIRDVLIEWHEERGEAVSMTRLDTLVDRLLKVMRPEALRRFLMERG